MEPIIRDRITPYVQMKYTTNTEEHRKLTPCFNFVRRYRNGERKTHATQRDGHEYATVVICLADFDKEYRGGVYVATAERYKKTVALNRGDAIVHKHDLLHGVKVKNDGGERWSWILWYRDSDACENYDSEWFKDKAEEGFAVYQSLYATVLSGDVMIEWLKKSAEQGLANSMVKLARGYLKLLPSNLEYNPAEAERLYRAAIDSSQDPHAQYGLAQMMLSGLIEKKTTSMWVFLKQVIELLEESAKGGHVFAMFNLGIAHLYGYSGNADIQLAKDWFESCELPEGFMLAAMYYDSQNDAETADALRKRAVAMGYGTQWRKLTRNQTGLGGAGGVDINLSWPTMPNGNKPCAV